MSKEANNYLIKDKEGEYISITADNWECGGNGLKFYLDAKVIAWFVAWQHYRKVN